MSVIQSPVRTPSRNGKQKVTAEVMHLIYRKPSRWLTRVVNYALPLTATAVTIIWLLR